MESIFIKFLLLIAYFCLMTFITNCVADKRSFFPVWIRDNTRAKLLIFSIKWPVISIFVIPMQVILYVITLIRIILILAPPFETIVLFDRTFTPDRFWMLLISIHWLIAMVGIVETNIKGRY